MTNRASGSARRAPAPGGAIERLIALFGPRRPAPAATAARLLSRERFAGAQAATSAFYCVVAFLAVGSVSQWPAWIRPAEELMRWPVDWLRWVDPAAGSRWILGFHLVACLAGAAAPGRRWMRAVVALSMLEFYALKYSFGAIDHGDHLSILIAWLLVALPRGWRAPGRAAARTRVATLLVFAGCQSLILLTYSMAGFWKLAGALRQSATGEISALAPTGLARQIAAKMLAEESTTPLGPWLIDHPWIGWALMLGMLYLQFFALWVAPRPSLHALWAGGLIAFHVTSQLSMGIGFPNNVLWLAIFFFVSPLRPRRFVAAAAARELPVLGAWLARFEARQRLVPR